MKFISQDIALAKATQKTKKMKKAKNSLNLIALTQHKPDLSHLDFALDTVILLTGNRDAEYQQVLTVDSLSDQLSALRKKIEITDIMFISKNDRFSREALGKDLRQILKKGIHEDITLLIPYSPPPDLSQRIDGKVQSALISSRLFFENSNFDGSGKFWKIIYNISYNYLNSSASKNISIFQVGKPGYPALHTDKYAELLNKSLLIIPHKGSVKLLNRCLSHLNNTRCHTPRINVCFDDSSYEKIDPQAFANLALKLKIFLNMPGNVGPYLPRHYSAINSNKELIFFHDSDDISINNRFIRQLAELSERKLDMVGSHELRVDQFARCLMIVRYPLEVNRQNSLKYFYPLFHPTTLITKKAYQKAKGFSTDRRFGYDYQFLLRACFLLKIGNIDDFLYIRFRRPNSLTTRTDSKIGSTLRSFLSWRWVIDYKLVNEHKLNLDDSSLRVQKHTISYRLMELPHGQTQIKKIILQH